MGADGNLEQVVAMEMVRSLILYQFCSVAAEFAKGFAVRKRLQKIKEDSEVLGCTLRCGGGAWTVRLSHGEIPWRGGCKTQAEVGQEENGGETLITSK